MKKPEGGKKERTPDELRARKAARHERADAAAEPPQAQPSKKAKKARAAEGGAEPPRLPKSKKGAAPEELPCLASLPPHEQGEALWHSYKAECGGSFLEEEAFGAEHFCAAQAGADAQARLKAAAGPGWRDLLARAPASTPPGAPTCLVVSGAALRCIELIRLLPELHRGVPIAKLFGKHLKPAEQAELLGGAAVCVGVGTPARLDKLVALGALSLARLQLLVIDCSRDLKKRSLLDIPETRRDLWALWRSHLAEKVTTSQLRVLCIE